MRGALAAQPLGLVAELGVAGRPRRRARARSTSSPPEPAPTPTPSTACCGRSRATGSSRRTSPGSSATQRPRSCCERRRRLGRVRAALRWRLAPHRGRARGATGGRRSERLPGPTSGRGSRAPRRARRLRPGDGRGQGTAHRPARRSSSGAATRRSSTSAAETARCSSRCSNASPGLRGIVFDLPETVRDEAALGERIEFVEGSFFERVPAGDVFVLGTVLHDWDDESATRILQTIRARGARGRAPAGHRHGHRRPETSPTARNGSTC